MTQRKPEGYIDGVPLHPESLMMSYGYKPEWSEGAIKCPIFQTSTFVFKTAEEGKAFFELAYGLREPKPGEQVGLIYSRINNPDLEILEDRLCLWDEAEDGAVFESGMAAIATTVLAYVRPGDMIFHNEPLYGGTDHLFRSVLREFGIHAVPFPAGAPNEQVEAILANSPLRDRLAMIYIETPANPTNALVDIEFCSQLARKYAPNGREVVVAVDNTFLGTAVAASAQAWRGLGTLLCHEVHRRAQRCDCWRVLGQPHQTCPRQAAADLLGHDGRSVDGLAADAQSRNAQAAHDRANEKTPAMLPTSSQTTRKCSEFTIWDTSRKSIRSSRSTANSALRLGE
jgi:hypothetical protein